MKQVKMVMISVGVAAAALSSCSAVDEVVNDGGDTTCKDFQSADEKAQNKTIAKMLTDEGGSEPANAELAGTRISVTVFCQTVGKADSTVKEAPHL